MVAYFPTCVPYRGVQAHRDPFGDSFAGADGADPLGVHVEAFVEGEEDSRDEDQEVKAHGKKASNYRRGVRVIASETVSEPCKTRKYVLQESASTLHDPVHQLPSLAVSLHGDPPLSLYTPVVQSC